MKMKSAIEIENKLMQLLLDDRLPNKKKKEKPATIVENAPLALVQLSLESKIATLEWVLGKRDLLIIG